MGGQQRGTDVDKMNVLYDYGDGGDHCEYNVLLKSLCVYKSLIIKNCEKMGMCKSVLSFWENMYKNLETRTYIRICNTPCSLWFL